MNPLRTLLAIGLLSLSTLPMAAQANTEAAAPAGLTDLKLTKLDGSAFDAGSLKGKAVLFVNVASRCGYTRQYDGLQALYEKKKDEGLVIVGVPSNQFGGQEPGTAKEIATFCRMNYGVTFPMLEKQDVNGTERSALYRWLVGSDVGAGKDVGWNFEKFLVDSSGNVVGRFSSGVEPLSGELTSAISKAL